MALAQSGYLGGQSAVCIIGCIYSLISQAIWLQPVASSYLMGYAIHRELLTNRSKLDKNSGIVIFMTLSFDSIDYIYMRLMFS